MAIVSGNIHDQPILSLNVLLDIPQLFLLLAHTKRRLALPITSVALFMSYLITHEGIPAYYNRLLSGVGEVGCRKLLGPIPVFTKALHGLTVSLQPTLLLE